MRRRLGGSARRWRPATRTARAPHGPRPRRAESGGPGRRGAHASAAPGRARWPRHRCHASETARLDRGADLESLTRAPRLSRGPLQLRGREAARTPARPFAPVQRPASRIRPAPRGPALHSWFVGVGHVIFGRAGSGPADGRRRQCPPSGTRDDERKTRQRRRTRDRVGAAPPGSGAAGTWPPFSESVPVLPESGRSVFSQLRCRGRSQVLSLQNPPQPCFSPAPSPSPARYSCAA